MKNVRLGNDLIVAWSIVNKQTNEPLSLEDRDIALYLCTPFGKQKQEEFVVHENVVTWTFYGKDQKYTGKYSLELVINEGAEGMATTDVCDFVNLVPCVCKVGGADGVGVQTESIELLSSIEFGGYDDTELREAIADLENEVSGKQDTIADLDQIREGAAKGATALQSVPSEYVTEGEMQSALSGKVDKVSGKGLSTNDYTTTEKNKLASLQNYDDTALRNEVAQKASTEGYYPKLEVGKADNLPDRVDVTEGVITFRESAGEGNSIEDGTAEVKQMEGDTLVWNQQFLNGDFSQGKQGWYGQNGNTFDVADGVATVTITSTPQYEYWAYLGFEAKKRYVVGHKYLLSAFAFLPKESAVVISSSALTYLTQHDFAKVPANTWVQCSVLCEAKSNNLLSFAFYPKQKEWEVGDSWKSTKYVVYDLTQMFGAGNEPTTIEEFNKRIPVGVDLYAYNEGEVVNVNINGIKSVNDNAFNGEYAKVIGGKEYCIDGTISSLSFAEKMDGERVAITLGADKKCTPSTNGYIFANGTNVCIHLVHSGYKDHTYTPHEEDTMLVDTAKYFPQGMNGINGVRDSLSMNEKVQRIGIVKMKDLNWILTTSSGGYNLIYADFNSIKVAGACACTKYSSAKATSDFGAKLNEKSICVHIERSRFVIKDSSFSTSDSFKEQLTDNDYIYYELAEPIVEEIYPPLNLSYKVWDFGTEEIITDKSAPLITKAIYGFNATDTIRGNKARIQQNTDEIEKLKAIIAEMQAAMAQNVEVTDIEE